MRIFPDANILVSVVNKEYPLFTYFFQYNRVTDQSKFILYTLPVCSPITFILNTRSIWFEIFITKRII